MNLIIPMAGRGTRLRPHTLTVPKPLVSVAGKPIVQRLVEDLVASIEHPFDEIAFIIGDFGKETEDALLALAEKLGAKGRICYQLEQLGTAHAIMCAKEVLHGPCVVAFADTLFRSGFRLDTEQDGVIWVQQVPDPSAYGVVKLDAQGMITDFVEKPKTFVSDLAIVGIYYFKDGEYLKSELQYLLDNDIQQKGEFQLTDALENMRLKGTKFAPGQISEWLDCGNKDAVVFANQRVLDFNGPQANIDPSVKILNSTIIQPCFLAPGVQVENAVVGPYVSLGLNTQVRNAVVSNSLVQDGSTIENVIMKDSMVGSKVVISEGSKIYNVGDYTVL
jgi:glucose-1-phosphate thymidylyltransferase